MFKKRKSESDGTPNKLSNGSSSSSPLFSSERSTPSENLTLAETSVNKDLNLMNRPTSPFPGTSPITPSSGTASRVGNTLVGSSNTQQQNTAPRRTLTVGLGISVKGNIENAEQLVVEGEVEADNIKATEISIAKGGVFRGNIEVENAEIYGKMDGTLTASKNLTIHSTGQIVGHARCKKLQVEEGGQVSGQMEMITDSPEKPFSTDSFAAKKDVPAPSIETVIS